ncbi:P-loop containing nucleoside triphosphate hydrolase protein [Desarmillaria tabescens]|uniref:P-loop containing nucleoside triphosphate hydrolase protein n=1 Tax=Armillaria tabescens TaxID=1929756 RepID=A0AA39ND48_ARMTA|nr:P-loop containing nucleoside triphosphate hydrolase protein [Desarmillaria tabescens]KAK0463456.1 P-loop containing nucleoside triphosphate hydrolase protein [Desarmillaria tabescens]
MMDHYASRRKDMLAIMNQLHSIGAQTYLELPRIVVIGNQSAGKSSVVEAISGITVPRDAGTCTRCPMECRLASSEDPWCCQISIRYEFEPSNGRRLKDVMERKFGGLILKKDQVEPMLRRAQWAVLNPKLSYAHVLGMSMHDMYHNLSSSALQFSRNVVCVDLKGPDLTDLSFIDLPGIIQNAETETVKLVEDMVVSHIAGDCLILVALPMTDDVENQKALKLANLADPQGRRTIGVLTKPDMLPEGSVKNRALWLDVIEGRRFPLKHGYYCTRHPDDADRSQGLSSAEARKAEMDFFARTEPWNISIKPHYFGVKNLTAALSSLLIQVIQEALPKIQLEATRQLETCRDELEHLPKPIVGDPATYMLQLITALCDDVNLHVRGSSQTSKMIQDNRAAFAKFKIEIRKTAPNFVSSGEAKEPVDDDDEDGGVLTTSAPFTVSDMRKHIQRSITRELPNNVPFDAKVALITSFQRSWPHFVKSCFDNVRNTVLNTLLACVDHERLGRYDLLRHHLHSFISEIVSEQYASCHAFLDAILEVELSPFTQNLHYLDSSSEKWLAKYKGARQESKTQAAPAPAPAPPVPTTNPVPGSSISPGPLKTNTSLWSPRPVPISHSSDSSNESDSLLEPLHTASQTPKRKFKSNSRISASTSTPISTSAPVVPIWDQRPVTSGTFLPAENVSSPFDQEKMDHALAALAALGFAGLTAEDLEKLHPVDEYETELKVMAEVRGYFQVSYKRIIDYVPSLIDLKFIKAVGKALQPFLIKKFELGSNEANAKCAKYLAEDPGVTAEREELCTKKRLLEKVQEELYRFGGL